VHVTGQQPRQLCADLTVAVQAGMILAVLLYVRRVFATTTVTRVTPAYLEDGRAHILQDKSKPDCVTVVRIHGPFLFGATDKLETLFDVVDAMGAVVIFRLRNMTAIDATALAALEEAAARLRASGRAAGFCGAREQPSALMQQAGFAASAGQENVCPDIAAALRRAHEIHDGLSHAA
jgi:SulP family sulfate permease